MSTKIKVQVYWLIEEGLKTRHSHAPRRQLYYTQVVFNSRYWLDCHLNLRVSGTTIENLRWQFSEDINFITFGKFVTLLVQQLEKKCVHKNCATRYWLPTSLFTFILKFFTNFPKVTWIISPPNRHLRFSIVVLETFIFKKKVLAM